MPAKHNWQTRALRFIHEQGNGQLVRYRGDHWTYRGCAVRGAEAHTRVGEPDWLLTHAEVELMAQQGLLQLHAQLPNEPATNATLTELGRKYATEGQDK